jgi:hypothetical protein
MSEGPGKYDHFCKFVLEATDANGCVLIVLRGNQGTGTSVNITPETLLAYDVPKLLRDIADKLALDREKTLRSITGPVQ